MVTFTAVKKSIDKGIVWCRQHWRWLILSSVALIAFLLGRKNASVLKVQAILAREQYEKEAEMIEKAHAEKELKKKAADRKYKKALDVINKKHELKISSLDLQKEREFKARLKAVKNDPDELDKILKDMGIEEV